MRPRAQGAGIRRAFRLIRRATDPTAIDDEIRFHLEERVDELVREGMTRQQATAAVLRRFGDVGQVTAKCAEIDKAMRSRRSRRDLAHDIGTDIAYAARRMVASPLLTAVIVATLAVGIGATVAVYSLVDRTLLHPLPTAWIGKLVVIQDDFAGLNLHRTPISPGEALDLFRRTDLFQSVAAFTEANVDLTGASEPERLVGVATLGDFFGLLGIRPYLGRFYRPQDSENGNHHVVVLSYATWRDALGADSSMIGRIIRLNDESYQVVGVLPPNFRFPQTAQVYTPATVSPKELTPDARGDLFFTAIARPRLGMSRQQLRADLTAQADRWHEEFGSAGYARSMGHTLISQPLTEDLAGDLRPILRLVMGAVALVLLIACANVACLQLARGTRRAREMALRAAIGADRWRLVRQLLIENAALATVGGLLGLAISVGLLESMARSDAANFGVMAEIRPNATVLVAAALATICTVFLFGALPAAETARVDAATALKEGGTRDAGGAPRARRSLAAATSLQVALAFVLLLTAGLTLRSLANLLRADPGFRPDRVMTAQLSLHSAHYVSPASRLAFQAALLARLRGLPGIQSATTAFGLPFTNTISSSQVRVVGHPVNEQTHVNIYYVGGNYFKTMGIRLLAGRTFTDADGEGATPVVVIDQTLARQILPGENPIGQQIDQGGTSTIVGEVASIKQRDLGIAGQATIYYHLPQVGGLPATLSIAVRSVLPAGVVATLLRSTVRELDKDVPVYDVLSMPERVARSFANRRLATLLFSGFGLVALLLSVLGVYGVLSYSVADRRHELGIRAALGADQQRVVTLVTQQGLRLIGSGLAIGLIAFLAVGPLLGTLLYGIGDRDPITIAATGALMVAVGLTATWLPAWHAGRIDPMEALRTD